MLRRCLPSLLVITVGALSPIPRATAESLADQPARYFQIRSSDRRINAAVEEGLRASATFRELAHRINASNVVVYVTAESATLPPGIDGRLTFLSATGGFRYVVVRVNTSLPMLRLVALIGHELQHAREIAETDMIVDSASLAREYAGRLGYPKRVRTGERSTFDSDAAVRAGEQVLREVLMGQ